MGIIIFKKECTKCRESGNDNTGDNLNVYDDGSSHCFACGYNSFKSNDECDSMADDKELKTISKSESNSEDVRLITETGHYSDLPGRRISKRTCEKYQVKLVEYKGQTALAFPRFKNGIVVGYKLKYSNGDYTCIGESKNVDMFGGNWFDAPDDRTLIITEGEVDALTVNQLLGDIYHVTTLNAGASSVSQFIIGDKRKNIQGYYDALSKYKSIILCLDNDITGIAATNEFITLFNQIGKIKIAKLPLKDANDMAQANRLDELKWAILKAEIYKPKQIVDIMDIIDEILVKPEMGRPWPWQSLTNINNGCYLGKKYLIAGAEDIGKTTFIKDIVFHFTEGNPQWKGGLFFLEQKVKEVVHKLISSKVKHNLEQPSCKWWDTDEIRKQTEKLATNLHFFDPTIGIDLTEIINSIYYFANVNKVQFIIIDNLTILSTNCRLEGKRVSHDDFFREVGNRLDRIALELNIAIFVVGHVNRNTISRKAALGTKKETIESYKEQSASSMNELYNHLGLTWESGRIPTIADIDGGKICSRLFHEVWVISRNMVSQDNYLNRLSRIDILKCKNRVENSPGYIEIVYNPRIGKYEEIVKQNTNRNNPY